MAFSNPLTFANIVSASTFELLDSTGTVVMSWFAPTSTQGSLLGPGGAGHRATIGVQGDGATTSSLGLGAGQTLGEAATLSLTEYLFSGSNATLSAYAGGSAAAELSLNAPSGAVLLTSTGITYNTRSVSFVQATAEAASTANLALGAADVAIPGCSITHTLNTGDVVVITGTFDFGNAGATSTAWGSLYVNGAQYAGGRGPGHTIGAGGRSTVSHSWRYVAASAGSYTFVLRARQSAGTWTAYQPFGAGGTVISTVLYCTT